MRYKFIILFLFISFVSKAQVYQLMPQYGYNTFRMNFDSTIQIPTFCGVPKLGSNVTKKGALAFDSCNNRFYFFNPKLQVWDTIKSADANLFVKYTDTASLVAPYLRKGDTIFLSQRIDQRVKYSDTSLMLLPYLRVVDTTNKWVNSVTKLNDSTIQVIKGTTTSNITISSVSSATRLITQVWNNTGATILRGSVVYISGRHSSNLPTIALAQGNNEANSYKTFALVDGDIADNSSGFVIQAGKITGLNLPTSSYTDGDILYLSPTVAGGYTITKPLAPYHICKLGSVTRAHPTQGSIEIKIENGWQLDELSDVQIAAIPLDSTILQFSRIDSLWHDVNPTTAMGNRFVKSTDSAAMLQPYLRKSDTLSISNRINTKLNISDTANTWVTSVFRKTASDSVFFVRGGSNNFAFRDSAGAAGWSLTGNSGTSDATNFIGTTDNQDLVFRRNNVISGRIDSSSVNFGSTTFGFGTTGTSLSDRGITAFGYKALASNTASGSLGIANTAVGNRALQNNTSGSNNSAVGHNALVNQNNGTGDYTAVGAFALENTNSGQYSTAVGSQALRNQTYPQGNTAVGALALSQVTITGLNTAIGMQSGQYFGGSTSNNLTSTSSSTYLGYLTYAGGNSQSNQTVIGANAVGAGSNTVTLGDNNITATYLKGTLGLGRTWTSSAPSVAASALLDMESTTRGFLQPRLTTTQMNAISTPATGLSVFNTTDSSNYVYRGSGGGWQNLITSFSPTITTPTITTGMTINRAGVPYIIWSQNGSAIAQLRGITQGVVVADNSGGTVVQLNNTNNLFDASAPSELRHNFGAQVLIQGANQTTNNAPQEVQRIRQHVTLNQMADGFGSYTTYQGRDQDAVNNTFSAIGGVRSGADNTGALTLYTANAGTLAERYRITPTGQLSNNTTPNASAVVDISSTTQGFLPPRMTTAQRDLIATPAAGLIIYNTTTNKHQGYNGTTWNDFY